MMMMNQLLETDKDLVIPPSVMCFFFQLARGRSFAR
jgi:hypothetical protein